MLHVFVVEIEDLTVNIKKTFSMVISKAKAVLDFHQWYSK